MESSEYLRGDESEANSDGLMMLPRALLLSVVVVVTTGGSGGGETERNAWTLLSLVVVGDVETEGYGAVGTDDVVVFIGGSGEDGEICAADVVVVKPVVVERLK